MSNAQAIVEHDDHRVPAVPVGAVTPLEMLNAAFSRGDGLEKIEKLMVLQERWEATQARKAFNEAFAAFKAEAVKVVRNRKVDDGPLRGRRYAELVAFVDAATPALSAHGLSASWNITRDEKDWIEVTCTIEHELGGKKTVSLGGPPDAGGAKNPLQARISTVTYLERATFKAATGLAEQGDDDDGQASGAPATISEQQLDTLDKALTASGADEAKFFAYFGLEYLSELPANRFDEAMKLVQQRARSK